MLCVWSIRLFHDIVSDVDLAQPFAFSSQRRNQHPAWQYQLDPRQKRLLSSEFFGHGY